MMKTFVGAAAMAAAMYSTVPASAATMGSCSGANLTKTESAIDVMADGPSKSMAQKEVASAQTAMLNGKMGECAKHLNTAMHAGMTK